MVKTCQVSECHHDAEHIITEELKNGWVVDIDVCSSHAEEYGLL